MAFSYERGTPAFPQTEAREAQDPERSCALFNFAGWNLRFRVNLVQFEVKGLGYDF